MGERGRKSVGVLSVVPAAPPFRRRPPDYLTPVQPVNGGRSQPECLQIGSLASGPFSFESLPRNARYGPDSKAGRSDSTARLQ
jgi:hypothetical protein